MAGSQGAATCVVFFFLLVGFSITTTTSATSQTYPLGTGAGSTLPDPTIIKLANHLDQFMQIATANGGDRAQGSEGADASLAYVSRRLVKIHEFCEVHVEHSHIAVWRQLQPAKLSMGTQEFKLDEDFLPGSYFGVLGHRATGGVISTSAVSLPKENQYGCQPNDAADLRGKIALMQRGGTCDFYNKSMNAQLRGAVAVLIVDNVAGVQRPRLYNPLKWLEMQDKSAYPFVSIPVMMVSTTVGKELQLYEGVNVTLATMTSLTMRTSSNLFCTTKNYASPDTVLVGAHLDTVIGSPGMNDNAAGAAALIEIAFNMSLAGPWHNRIKFAWWGAEELGLLGSRQYARDHIALAGEKAEPVKAYINFDMIGTKRVTNYPHLYSILNGSTFDDVIPGCQYIEQLLVQAFLRIVPADTVQVTPRRVAASDYYSFVELNQLYNATSIATGGLGITTTSADPCYHSACDTPDNVDLEFLFNNLLAAREVIGQLGRDTELIQHLYPKQK